MKHFNKRNKTSDMLFKIVEYGGIAFGVNAFLPDSPITPFRAFMGIGILILLFIIALLVTPEVENKKEEK